MLILAKEPGRKQFSKTENFETRTTSLQPNTTEKTVVPPSPAPVNPKKGAWTFTPASKVVAPISHREVLEKAE